MNTGNELSLPKFFRYTKRCLCMSVCSHSTRVIFGHNIILTVSANVGIKPAGFLLPVGIVAGPYLLPEMLDAQQCPDFMETLPPRLLTARRSLWFLHYGDPAHGVVAGGRWLGEKKFSTQL